MLTTFNTAGKTDAEIRAYLKTLTRAELLALQEQLQEAAMLAGGVGPAHMAKR